MNPYIKGDKLRIKPEALENSWVESFMRGAKVSANDCITFRDVAYANAAHGPLLIFDEYNGSGLWATDVELADGPW